MNLPNPTQKTNGRVTEILLSLCLWTVLLSLVVLLIGRVKLDANVIVWRLELHECACVCGRGESLERRGVEELVVGCGCG